MDSSGSGRLPKASGSYHGDLPAFTWEDEPTTLAQFADEFTSPHFVKLEPNISDEREAVFNMGDLVDVHKPFLAFSRRRRTRVYAENLAWDAKKKLYVPNGHVLEIPKDYMGWFEVLPMEKASKPPDHYSTIGDLANSGASHFLLCTPAAGLLGSTLTNGDLQLTSEVRMYPGEILHIEDTLTKTWKLMGDQNGDKSNSPQTKFLRCSDRKKRQMYFPFAHPGKFCAIADKISQDANVVYQVSTLADMSFPLLARMVFGWPPDNYPDFTGLLRLGGYNRVDTLVLYCLIKDRTIITEVPLDIDLKLYKVSNMEDIKSTKTFGEIIDTCCTNVFPYVTSLKSLSVKYKRQIKEAADENQNETRPESGEDKQTPKTKMGRMAAAMDMNMFSPLKVFPAREDADDEVSDTWSLSFKDPEFLYEERGNVIEEDTVWVEGEGMRKSQVVRPGGSKKVSTRDMRASYACDMGQSYTVLPNEQIGMMPLPKMERRRDLRATRERELKTREARC